MAASPKDHGSDSRRPDGCHQQDQQTQGVIDPRDSDQAMSLLRHKLNVPVRGGLLVSFNPDTYSDYFDVRPSTLLDVIEGGEIVLAQTEPQVLRSMVGTEVILSSILRNDSGPARFGLRAQITRTEKLTLLYDQQETVILVALTLPVQVIPVNARMGVRIELDGHSLLTFSSGKIALVPINISIGGVGFFVPKNQVKTDEELEITLDLPGQCVPAVVRVIRVSPATNRLDYVGGGPSWKKARASATGPGCARPCSRPSWPSKPVKSPGPRASIGTDGGDCARASLRGAAHQLRRRIS